MFRPLLIVALLGMCLAGPATAKKEEPTPAELAGTHGLVTARYHGTLPAELVGVAGTAPPVVTLKSMATGDEILLTARKDDPQSFGDWLPAGRYQLAAWRGSPWPDAPEVEVVAGRITDLGLILEVSLGGDDVVLLPLRHPDVDRKLQPWLAEAGGVLVSPEPLRWLPETVPAAITVRLQSTAGMVGGGLLMDLLMKSQRKGNRRLPRTSLRAIASTAELQEVVLAAMPPTRDDPASDEAGNQYFPAGFGRIRVRGADGAWSTLDTGTLAHILTVEWHTGRLIAGTVEGTLLASDDGGRQWATIRRFDPLEMVSDIDRVGDRWLVATSHRTVWQPYGAWISERATVYAATADDFADLVELRRFELKNRFQVLPLGMTAGDAYYVTVSPVLARLDLISGEWSEVRKRGGPTAFLEVSPRTGALTSRGTAVMLSTDGGGKWLRVQTPHSAVAWAMMHDGGDGWVVRWVAGFVTSVLEVNRYERGKGWQVLATVPLGCNLVLRDGLGEPNLCAAWEGSILHRDGSDWVSEFAVD